VSKGALVRCSARPPLFGLMIGALTLGPGGGVGGGGFGFLRTSSSQE